jgi:hypothetical protein
VVTYQDKNGFDGFYQSRDSQISDILDNIDHSALKTLT